MNISILLHHFAHIARVNMCNNVQGTRKRRLIPDTIITEVDVVVFLGNCGPLTRCQVETTALTRLGKGQGVAG